MPLIDDLNTALRPRYAVEGEVGRGGFSVVFRAHDLEHDRPVAVKVLHPEIASATAPERFLREIRIAATLQHPNVLPLLDSGAHEGLLYYIMPFVEGESLREHIDRIGALGFDDALDIAIDVADALGHAHEQAVVHRDVKPANILLTGGRAMLADFGIARGLAGVDQVLTTAGHTPGTPKYMSPEQASGAEAGPPSDVYSLACVLYEMLAGDPPFAGRSARAVVARHMVDPPPSIETVRHGLPGGVAEAVETALRKVPGDRFPSGSAFATALRKGRSSAVRTARPRRLIGWGAAAVAVAILAVLAFPWATPELDSNRLLVFPLETLGSTDVAEAGWDVALALGTALEHTEPLRWLDARHWLSDALRADPTRIDHDAAVALAEDREAGRYLTGAIRHFDDSLAVTLRVVDVASGDVVAQRTESGLADVAAHRLGLRAIAGLLPDLLEDGREVDLTPLTDRAPGAIALTIQGDRAYRRSDFEAALGFYQRAVAEDSLMAIAAARGARAASFLHRDEVALRLAETAVRSGRMLPARHLDFVRGVEAFQTGQADTAVARLEAALATDPDWAEARSLLGETYYHLFPTGASPLADAHRAFREAAESDSTFAPPLRHLIELDLIAGDLAAAERSIVRLATILGESDPDVRVAEHMAACVGEGGAGDWTSVAQQWPARVLSAAVALATAGYQHRCAEQAFEAVAELGGGWSWGATIGLQALRLARGDVHKAVTHLDAALSSGMGAVYGLYLFGAMVSPAFSQRAADADRLMQDRFGPQLAGADGVNRWLVGSWRILNGDPESVQAMIPDLRIYLDDPAYARTADVVIRSLEWQIALATTDGVPGSVSPPSSPTAAPDAMYWSQHEALALDRILHARRLLEVGAHDEAMRVAATLDHPGPMAFVAFLAPSLAIRRAAAEALGRPDLVRRFDDRLLDLGWVDAVVPLSPTGPLLGPLS
ncbi:MAG: protein kinase [Gemmatimonadetes bacterium]|nr:protein kinase [Gemmatimonadota bacterium]